MFDQSKGCIQEVQDLRLLVIDDYPYGKHYWESGPHVPTILTVVFQPDVA